jgi:sec-independent protein translocase protein TatA
MSATHILIVALVILILFGSAAIPKFARSLGRAKSEFEKGLEEGRKDTEAEKSKPAATDQAKGGDKPAA